MRPVLPYTWVICYRATIGGPRNPSISLANTTLEHALLLFEASSRQRTRRKGACAHMMRTRAYTIDSCYVGFAAAGRYPWVRSWWQRLVGR